MASKVVEEVVTMLTGDSSGVEGAFARSIQAARGNARNEKIVSDEISKIRKNREREFLLAPIREAQAAQKAADSRVRTEQRAAEKEKAIVKKKADDKIKAEKESSDKIRKQQEASSLPNVVKELRANFGSNAKQKVGGFLQDKLGLSEDAAQGIVGKMGRLAPVLTVVGAGAAILAKTFLAARDRAGEQAEKMHQLSEEMQKASKVNVFASSTDGVDSLSASIEEARQNVIKSKQTLQDDDPYNQGGGVLGGMRTIAGNTIAKGMQFGADLGLPTGADSSFDKQARERTNLQLNQRKSEQDQVRLGKLRTEAVNRDLILTHARLTMDQQTVAIQELQLQKETALNNLKRGGDFNKQDADRTALRFDMQIRQQEELRDAMGARQNLQEQILGLANRGMTQEQQSISAARMRNEEIEEELQNRKLLTVEEARAFELERAANQNAIREAQLSAVMKSPGQQNRDAIGQMRREARLQRAQERLNHTDGLRNIERDASGNILGGVDITTGQRRAVSSEFDRVQRAKDQNARGFSGGMLGNGSGLETGSLNRPGFDRTKYTIPYMDSNNGSNDQSAGNTLLTAAKAQVEATNISNDYLKQIQVDISNLPTALAFK